MEPFFTSMLALQIVYPLANRISHNTPLQDVYQYEQSLCNYRYLYILQFAVRPKQHPLPLVNNPPPKPHMRLLLRPRPL